ncbi:hypothetical protein [Streptomyces albogriseolus]|uniref:hypothetical protein n=1 Tax=Streptomyces albogriseolus TaxID=1887 RepID=UPI003F4A2C27
MQIYSAFHGYLKVGFRILLVAVMLWAAITGYLYVSLLTFALTFFFGTPTYSSLKNDLRCANCQAMEYFRTRRLRMAAMRKESAAIPDSI